MENNIITVNGATSESQMQAMQKDLLATLAKLGEGRTTDESLVFEGTKFIIPESMSVRDARKYLKDWEEANEEPTYFTRDFKFRPWDGAAAVARALKKVFGMAGIGAPIQTFFGKNPPEMRSITVGPNNQTMQVPWGKLLLSALPGTELYLQAAGHEELGTIFRVGVETPKKYKAHIEGLFNVIEEELATNSIYRGKAFDDKDMPDFIDTASIDPSQVTYSDDVMQQLDANLWAMLRHTDLMEELNVPLKRAVLFEGPYGTGKTLAGKLTAKVARENGWTFIYKRPGAGTDIRQVMATARMYQPAVLYIEDVDTIAAGDDTNKDRVSELLDVFDGIQSKGTKLIVVMTTNHVERIHKGMVRPGRLDAVIHVGALDRPGVERLTRSVIPTELLGDVNFDAVYDSMEGFMPAFVREALDRAVRYNVARTGSKDIVLDTADIVNAAHGLRPQLELMEGASEGAERDPLSVGFASIVNEALSKTTVRDSDGEDVYYRLSADQN